MVSVVAGFDLDQPVASREAPCQPNRVQRRFRAAVGEAPLRLFEATFQLLGHHRVVRYGLREMRALRRLFIDRLDDQGVGVPDRHHAEAVMKVDVFVAVDVPDTTALTMVDEDRLWGRVLEG